MGVFNSSKFIPTQLTDLSGVASALKTHFEGKGYTVESTDSSYGYFISLTKGGIFKSVIGMKTALNIDVRKVSGGISVDAKVGIFGQQLIPSLIMMFIAWPVIFAQITGLVQQSKLDGEAIAVIENAVRASEDGKIINADGAKQFCAECGAEIASVSRFCSVCGAKQ